RALDVRARELYRVEHVPEIVDAPSLSHRLRLRQYLGTELQRKIARRQQVDTHAEQLFQFHLQPAQIEQRGPGQRIDDQIEVTALAIRVLRGRTEHAQVRRIEPLHGALNGGSVRFKRQRWPHREFLVAYLLGQSTVLSS